MRRAILTGLGALSFTAAAVLAGPATAASVPGIAGHAWFASDSGCFTSGWSMMKNSCSSTKKLLVPVTTQTSGTWTVASSFYGGDSPKVVCYAVGNSNDGISGWVSGAMSSAGSPNPSYQTKFSSVYTPGGTLHFDCDVGPNASVSGLFWF